jgi:UDP-N-acetylmuramate dehydrogenase
MIKIGGEIRLDEPMAGHTSFRIGGPADLYALPASADDVRLILDLCARESVPCFILGGGTNILVSDKGIRGAVIDLSRLSGIGVEGTLLTAGAGAPMSDAAEAACGRGLSGMEFACRLPGTVGGAVYMNARCYDREAADVLESVEYLDADLTLRRYSMNRGDWSYKRSPFQAMTATILGACFRLAPGDAARIRAEMTEHGADRERKGHFLFPCAGSVFKNNRAFGAPTGRLIDSLGLKGRRIGGAQVAPFHGNIIINAGGATAEDVRALIECVEREVHGRLGFTLEREVELVGEWE